MTSLLNRTRFVRELNVTSDFSPDPDDPPDSSSRARTRVASASGSKGNAVTPRLMYFQAQSNSTRFGDQVEQRFDFALAAWLGSKTDASVELNLDISDLLTQGRQQTAVLVRLSGNSTNGLQTSLEIKDKHVLFTVTEMPLFILVGTGLSPQPPLTEPELVAPT